jgi:hypothetical protein
MKDEGMDSCHGDFQVRPLVTVTIFQQVHSSIMSFSITLKYIQHAIQHAIQRP